MLIKTFKSFSLVGEWKGGVEVGWGGEGGVGGRDKEGKGVRRRGE